MPARPSSFADRARDAHPALSLSVQTGDGVPDAPVPTPRLRRWVRAALRCDARITLRFVGSREGRSLNRAYRGRDYATNVLTFDYGESPAGEPPRGRVRAARAPACSADIVICVPVVEREARRQRKRVDHHLAHLVIHGVLHAQGLGHDDEIEAEAMEALETALLRRFRIGDPYAHARARTVAPATRSRPARG